MLIEVFHLNCVYKPEQVIIIIIFTKLMLSIVGSWVS